MPAAHRSRPPLPAHVGLCLSVALQRLLSERNDKPLTLGYIVASTGERAIAILCAFLCLPFLQPIPLPGVSIPFGLLIMLLGIQLAIGWHQPWLPKRVARWQMPERFAARLLRGMARMFNPLEKVIRPRLLFMQNRVAFTLVGVALAVDGLLLAILPPFPGSNLIPGYFVMIKVLGITEDDGITLIVGLALTAAAVAGSIVALIFGYGAFAHWLKW